MRGVDPPDWMYDNLCKAMVSAEGEDQFFYKIFLDVKDKHCIIIRENSEQISRGTTGFSCWQVGFVLMD